MFVLRHFSFVAVCDYGVWQWRREKKMEKWDVNIGEESKSKLFSAFTSHFFHIYTCLCLILFCFFAYDKQLSFFTHFNHVLYILIQQFLILTNSLQKKDAVIMLYRSQKSQRRVGSAFTSLSIQFFSSLLVIPFTLFCLYLANNVSFSLSFHSNYTCFNCHVKMSE